jgi:hypothetical protein
MLEGNLGKRIFFEKFCIEIRRDILGSLLESVKMGGGELGVESDCVFFMCRFNVTMSYS